MQPERHRYFILWPDCSGSLHEAEDAVWRRGLPPETRYPLAVLAEAAKAITASGLRFYLTKDPDRLPEYGPHVVAVLLQEERCKIPAYARYVRAVVRNLRSRPFLGFRPHGAMGRLEAVLLFEYMSDWALHLRSRHRAGRFRVPGMPVVDSKPRIVTIPLGYHSQEELPLLPMAERTLDSFFSGDVNQEYPRGDYRRWTSSSKVEARRQLWRVLEGLAGSPSSQKWRILRNELSAGASAADPAAYGSYSERMRQSRICLAPRGSMAESFRFFEGLRAGCLVVANRLPPTPFERGAPVLFVDHWREMPGILEKYARDDEALERYSRAGRRWWDERCSEAVVGGAIAEELNRIELDLPAAGNAGSSLRSG